MFIYLFLFSNIVVLFMLVQRASFKSVLPRRERNTNRHISNCFEFYIINILMEYGWMDGWTVRVTLSVETILGCSGVNLLTE